MPVPARGAASPAGKTRRGRAGCSAPVWGPKHPNAKFPLTNGETNVGTIAAFKVERRAASRSLANAWTSRNLVTPAAPAVANGVVFALSTGEWVRQANDKEGGLYQADERATAIGAGGPLCARRRQPARNCGRAAAR